MKRAVSEEEYKLIRSFQAMSQLLLQERFADRIERPLAFWALPNDRRLPLAFLGRSLRDLVNTPCSRQRAKTPQCGFEGANDAVFAFTTFGSPSHWRLVFAVPYRSALSWRVAKCPSAISCRCKNFPICSGHAGRLTSDIGDVLRNTDAQAMVKEPQRRTKTGTARWSRCAYLRS
jgi:hypothetical protein